MALSRSIVALGPALAVALAATPSSAAPHVFDAASHLPPHLAIMFSMSWFGIDKNDPQGAGPDPTWGNWRQEFPACGLKNDPATCVDFPGAGLQRSIGSKRRPEAGIYSASGKDEESRRRVDLMLSTLRRPCDQGARIDAWAPQLNSVKFTSKYPANQQSATWDYAYRALVTFYERADAAGLDGVVLAGNDATVYWHFGASFGVSTQAERLAALTDDIADTAKMAMSHPSSTKLAGKPLLAFYVDAALVSVAEWNLVLEGARAKSGVDFYALGTTLNSAYWGAFDILVPWVNLGAWDGAKGATLYDRAVAWQKEQHKQLVANVGQYPGRAMFGSIAPGFDDYTQNWGQCTPREIPREADVMKGQFDHLASLKSSGVDVRGLFLETWDDWTEGTEFEPDVTEGATKLVAARQGIGALFGDPPDPAGDAALSARWKGYGQARSCCFVGAPCPASTPPQTDLSCPTGGAAGAGGSVGTGGGSAGGTGGKASAGAGATGGATATGGAKATAGAGGAPASGGAKATGGTAGVAGAPAAIGGAPASATGGSGGVGVPSGAGASPANAANPGGSASSGGCGCAAPAAQSSATGTVLVLAALTALRRRRAARRGQSAE